MELEIWDMLPAEQKYTYSQSSQIMGQTGCIGHLRGDMDTNGNGFFTSWTDHMAHLKTDAFKQEFDDVINMLRFNPEYDGILKNSPSMTSAVLRQCCRAGIRPNAYSATCAHMYARMPQSVPTS